MKIVRGIYIDSICMQMIVNGIPKISRLHIDESHA